MTGSLGFIVDCRAPDPQIDCCVVMGLSPGLDRANTGDIRTAFGGKQTTCVIDRGSGAFEQITLPDGVKAYVIKCVR